MTVTKRRSGVLLHISSLHGEYSIGSFGKAAFEFVDFLQSGGFSHPINLRHPLLEILAFWILIYLPSKDF